MTLQELNDYIQDIIADEDLQETCVFAINDNGGEDDWFQTIGREQGDVVNDGVYYDKYGTLVVRLAGGRNGDGDWSNYLYGIAQVMQEIDELSEVDHTYIIDIINDCPDDVFDIRIGIHPSSGASFEE